MLCCRGVGKYQRRKSLRSSDSGELGGDLGIGGDDSGDDLDAAEEKLWFPIGECQFLFYLEERESLCQKKTKLILRKKQFFVYFKGVRNLRRKIDA